MQTTVKVATWDHSGAQKAEREFLDVVVTINRYHGNNETHCNTQTELFQA